MSFETDFDTAFTILLGKAAAVDPVGTPVDTGTGGTSTVSTPGIEFVIDGGASAITSGSAGGLIVPFDCVITKVELQEFDGISGSITVDIQAAAAGNSPSFASLCGGNTPHISSGRHYSDNGLSGWSTTLDRGDALKYVVSSPSAIKRVTVMLYVRITS